MTGSLTLLLLPPIPASTTLVEAGVIEEVLLTKGDRKKDKPAPSATATKRSKDRQVRTITISRNTTKRQEDKETDSPHLK